MRRAMRRSAVGAVLFWLALAPAAATAQQSADTLRIAWRDALPDVTPYFNSLRAGFVLAHQVWDCLLYRDPETFQIKPALAASYRWVDDRTLEFTLRAGVRFQNGDPLGPDDIVYTVQTALSDPRVAVPSNYAFLAGAERLDDQRVRVRLRQAFPAALEYLAMVLPILPKAYRERVGADGFARAPIGTGPYRISRFDGLREIDLERNEDYYQGSPKGWPAIGRLAITAVQDSAAEVARLLAGEADWIWQFDPGRFEEIARDPRLRALSAESMRIGYLSLDPSAAGGAAGPLAQQKVREAIMHAIDRQKIANEIGQGEARVLDAPCYPTQFGCDQAAAVRYDYDPAKSRRLLAEAGYPHGFATDLVSYVLPSVNRVVRDGLLAVGIDATLLELPAAEVVRRSTAGLDPLELGTWGSYSINDVSAILPYFFAGGPQDHARDPEIAALIRQGDSVRDVDQRRAAYSAAIKLISQRALFLPLSTFVTTYGVSRALNFRPFADELPRFFLASWR